MTFPQQQQFPQHNPGFSQPQPMGFPQQAPQFQQAQTLPQFPQPVQPAQVTTSAKDFLSGGGKSFNFGNAASGFKRLEKPFGGIVVGEPIVSQVTNFTTKQPEFWPDGRPREQLVVTIDTLAGPYPEREDPTDDGRRTLYVKGSMVNPFRLAVQQGNGETEGTTEVGGTLLGCHTGVNNTAKGQAYTWSFQYTPPNSPASPGTAEVQASQSAVGTHTSAVPVTASAPESTATPAKAFNPFAT